MSFYLTTLRQTPQPRPDRFLAAFVHRVLHLTGHMNMFVPMLLTLAALMLQPRMERDGRVRAGLSAPVRRHIFFLLLVNALLFSVLGGALLCRYLLPMYPLVLLLAVTTFYRRVPYWQTLAVLSAAAADTPCPAAEMNWPVPSKVATVTLLSVPVAAMLVSEWSTISSSSPGCGAASAAYAVILLNRPLP